MPSASSSAYLVAPPGGGPAPGVLVLHAWWGLTPFFRGVADRLADQGFVALVPDLHGDDRTASTPDEAEALLASTDPNVTTLTVMSAASTLRHMRATTDAPIGVLGFSMGASWAMWLATRAPDLVDATVLFYGTQDIDFEPARTAVLGHFAEHDEFVSDDQLVEMEAHLRLLDKDVEFHRYPGTGHWFFEDDRPAAYVDSAAHLAWDRTIAFLSERLHAEAAP
ncbi:MAG: dienelactone hydrolase family protein [Actinobacteria bacterium]|nr:dienelactone hydrolase family protein [Actinomycetota bacterium]